MAKFHSRARMKLVVDVPQASAADVGVNLGGAGAGVDEQCLDHAQVGAVLQQVSGKAVPKHVGRDVPSDAGQSSGLLDAVPQGDAGKGRAAFGEENVSWSLGFDELFATTFRVRV